MGRRPLGETPMSAAERQRLCRERIKMRGLTVEYVNPDLRGEYFNVEARLARAVSSLIEDGTISDDLALIIKSRAVTIIPSSSRVDMLYIEKNITNYLKLKEEDYGL